MGRKLYVGNIPYETGEAELQALFGAVGTVDSVRVMRDQATGRARGFAFVEMATDEEAQQAISQLNDTQFEGRALAVNEARPKPAFAGGGGGGGTIAATAAVSAVAPNRAGRSTGGFDHPPTKHGRSRLSVCRGYFICLCASRTFEDPGYQEFREIEGSLNS